MSLSGAHPAEGDDVLALHAVLMNSEILSKHLK